MRSFAKSLLVPTFALICLHAPAQAESTPLGLRAERLAEIDRAVEVAIGGNRLPGGVVWIEHGAAQYHRAYGKRAIRPSSEEMTEDTIFDAASLTKVVATAPSVMKLVETGKITVDTPVREYLPEFAGEGVTVRHLLTHSSMLKPGIPLAKDAGYDAGIRRALTEKPTDPPGTNFRYSDINYILLGEIVRKVSGRPLNEFAEKEIFAPLGMRDTRYLPAEDWRPRIAPTTDEGGTFLRGVVHDPTARNMGGVAGHAGLFTTAADLARFSRMMLREGELDGMRVFAAETVKLMTSVQSPAEIAHARRGLGWDIDSSYAGPRGEWFPVGSYGHTGWTGGSMWIDPFSRSFVILLSNRNHPTESGNVLPLRTRIGTLSAEAIANFNFAGVPGALPRQQKVARDDVATYRVRNGIDVLVDQKFAPLKGLRVGLITNHTGHDRNRESTVDLLKAAPEVQLVALFSPEHGLRGTVDEKFGDTTDEKTGLPVYSLYGETRTPKPEQLAGLDALIFDIQDIGCRFYTYPSTMGLAMEAAAKAGKKFFVLDRINPIAGMALEGPIHTGKSEFVAFHKMPLRHSMTLGEMAQMLNAERGWNCDLTVIRCDGWRRTAWMDQCTLPWTNPSPNMRSLDAATLYPGIGLMESALSVGRGTDTPFEIIGAPYADDLKLAAELNGAKLAGIRFIPVRFTPKASTFKDKECRGVQMVITDRDRLAPVDVGITVALTMRRLYGDKFSMEKMRTLLTDAGTMDGIKAGKPLAQIKSAWTAGLEEFKQRREKYLLY